MSLELLKKSLQEAPIVKKGEYSYLVSPITDGIPEIKPELLEEVIHKMQELIANDHPPLFYQYFQGIILYKSI